MTENIWYVAAIWMGLALVASLISIRVGISVALIEIVVGVMVGNIHFHGGQPLLQTTDWINFLAMLGSGVLIVKEEIPKPPEAGFELGAGIKF